MRIITFLIFAIFSANAQVTLRITSVPDETPAGSTIYFAGAANDWNPGNPAFAMQPDGTGALLITIPEGTGVSEFKFTRGSWPTVEGNATGGYLPNRRFTFTGSPQVINLTVLSWEDISGSGGNSTAADNVQVLNNAFYMPQLDRYRKIWIYLPPDYFTSTKNYPVLYMQDGQNLFDDATSFSGEWNVDETLNTLHAAGDYGAVVVGIENGGSLRLDEYSPWNNPNYGGGEGDLYMQFIAETLKPYIDANFRTLTEPQYNALIGSSMGAFISAYGVAKHPELFGKAGLFSPAFWFSMDNLSDYISGSPNTFSGLRLYFVAGQNESSSMVANINTIKSDFTNGGVQSANTFTEIDPAGTHTESFWSSEFEAAYEWLFSDFALSAPTSETNLTRIYQNITGEIVAEGLNELRNFRLFNMSGMEIGNFQIVNGTNAMPANLTTGIYLLKDDSSNTVLKIIKK